MHHLTRRRRFLAMIEDSLQISIVSTNVFMPGIIISKDDDRVPPQPRPGGEQGATAHEVCVCANGRIFAAWSPEMSLGRGCQALAPIACE